MGRFHQRFRRGQKQGELREVWRDEQGLPPPDPKDKKKAAAQDKNAAATEAESLPELHQLLLLAEGIDLEAAREAAKEAAAPVSAPVAAPTAAPAASAAAASAEGGDESEAADKPAPVLVHLRDGQLLRDYGLDEGSVVYLCLDCPRG